MQLLIGALLIAIFLRVIFSWIGLDPDNPIYGVVHEITEPILAPIRRFMPRMGMMDLSPLIAGFLLFIILRAAMSIF
ncbi:MAG: YggT family protein [Chloroflexi bacterium]|nr:YggT family protein [Chloroflexota bacterium]